MSCYPRKFPPNWLACHYYPRVTVSLISLLFEMPKSGVPKTCRICQNIITDSKSIYNIHRNTDLLKQQEVIQSIIGAFSKEDGHSSIVCKFCKNKLNRLARIDFGLKNTVNKLEEERLAVLSSLRSGNYTQFSTPQKSATKKRHLIKTPTPQKVVKRPLQVTPKATRPPPPLASQVTPKAPRPRPLASKCIYFGPTRKSPASTKAHAERDFEVKVSVKFLNTHKI